MKSTMDTNRIYAESIAKEYAPQDESGLVALKKLDRKAKMPATVFAYSFGIISVLILGAGMCFSMNVIGAGTTNTFILGVILGIIGIIGASVNYPIYKEILNDSKKKYASDILMLANRVSSEQ